MKKQYLVRNQSNAINGPYSKNEIIKIVQSGQITKNDEICESAQYWFHLYESDELSKFLGIDLPDNWMPEEDEENTAEVSLTSTKISKTSVIGGEAIERGYANLENAKNEFNLSKIIGVSLVIFIILGAMIWFFYGSL